MSEPADLGRCFVCEKALVSLRHVLSRQIHRIEYTQRGDTLNDQAALHTSMHTVKASFCGKPCRDQALPRLLTAEGLSPEFEHNRLEAGPICPCGKCGAPVDMTEPHVAWVKGECHPKKSDGELRTSYQWLDVLAVLCASCTGEGAKAEIAQPEPAAERPVPPNNSSAKPRARRRIRA